MGKYYVTITVEKNGLVFGDVQDGKLKLNQYGMIAQKYCLEIPKHYPECKVWDYIVMPDHVHGIVEIIRYNEKNDHSDEKKIDIHKD